MRVITNPGTSWEKEKQLADVVQVDDYMVDADNVYQVYKYAQRVAEQNARLIELLVEKGMLSLDDLGVFEVPPMEKTS